MNDRVAETHVTEIAELPGFRDIPATELREALRYARRRSIRAQRAICYQSEPADSAFVVVAGAAERLKYRADESTLILGRASPGEWIGLSEVLLSSTYLTDVVAKERTEILVYSKTALAAIRKKSSINDLITQYLARGVFRLHAQIELNRACPRMVSYILTHATNTVESRNATLKITQEEIAHNVGLARETVNKNLRELQAEGMIVLRRGRIEVLDREALAELVVM